MCKSSFRGGIYDCEQLRDKMERVCERPSRTRMHIEQCDSLINHQHWSQVIFFLFATTVDSSSPVLRRHPILGAVTNIRWMFFQGNLEFRRYNLRKELQGNVVVRAKWMIEFFQLFSLQHMPEDLKWLALISHSKWLILIHVWPQRNYRGKYWYYRWLQSWRSLTKIIFCEIILQEPGLSVVKYNL